jgi:hypothetical protein
MLLFFVGASALAAVPPERIALTRSGQRAAKAATLTAQDLAGGVGWTGGAVKPDLVSTFSCGAFHPKQSDLVVSGAAAATFDNRLVTVASQTMVYATAAMVRLDWQRSVKPALRPCLGSTLKKALPSGSRILAVNDWTLPLPPLTQRQHAYRVALRVPGTAGLVRLDTYVILVARGRTELELTAISPPTAVTERAELELARKLVARIAR